MYVRFFYRSLNRMLPQPLSSVDFIAEEANRGCYLGSHLRVHRVR